jgi:hypothetical protein
MCSGRFAGSGDGGGIAETGPVDIGAASACRQAAASARTRLSALM